MKRSPKNYTHAALANMLEQADTVIEHQRREMDDLKAELVRVRKDNDDLRQEVSAWRGK